MPSAERVTAVTTFTFCAGDADGTTVRSAGDRDGPLHPGHLSSCRYVALDGSAVIRHDTWRDDASWRAAAVRLHRGGRVVDRFVGRAVPGLPGPASGEPAAIVAVATRTFRDQAGTDAVLNLFYRSGAWKRALPGFVGATPFVRADGLAFVNLPRWTSRMAYEAWMADPRIGAGQDDIARYESAPPRYVICSVVDVHEYASAPRA